MSIYRSSVQATSWTLTYFWTVAVYKCHGAAAFHGLRPDDSVNVFLRSRVQLVHLTRTCAVVARNSITIEHNTKV
ncbi:hypothetical protein DPMN_043397 [Dreissena polymorpha]|uniref:Uncharacterized protein n=1 Tax=Dreissena polymorpha TaxID=45954 RepID=A0A9D4HXW8_DREPO|nr:hypothetical protein DPMN_043397 [Dreissena polymorpha]